MGNLPPFFRVPSHGPLGGLPDWTDGMVPFKVFAPEPIVISGGSDMGSPEINGRKYMGNWGEISPYL